jgi:hypothetical protein
MKYRFTTVESSFLCVTKIKVSLELQSSISTEH